MAFEHNVRALKYELITPDRQPADNVTYRETEPGEPGPVEKAEQQIKSISADFGQWLRDDFVELKAAWRELRKHPQATEVFLRFHHAIHTLSGNAAMLGCTDASQLAAPVARLIERAPTITNHIQLIDSALQAIGTAITSPTNSPLQINEVHEGIETIVNRWISKQSQTPLSGR